MNNYAIISIVVPKEIKQELRVIAASNSKTLAGFLRELLLKELESLKATA